MSVRIAVFAYSKTVISNIRQLLKVDPNLVMAGIFNNVSNIVAKVKSSKPDLILIDIDHPDINWGKTIKILKTHFPIVRILVQTSFKDDMSMIDVISAGASGYILKKYLNNSDLIADIKVLWAGGSAVSQYQLTQREKEVLTYLVNGLSYKQIQFELDIAYETVRSHVKHIYEKLQVDSLTKLVGKAIREQLI